MAGTVGWRWIFFAAAALSLVGMLMVAGTPESKTESKEPYKFDTAGVITFMIMMVSLQVIATQGGNFGWTSLPTLGLLAASIVFGIRFFRIESGNPHGFVDFTRFRNMTYTVLRNVRELTRANAEGFGCTFEIRQGVPPVRCWSTTRRRRCELPR